MVKEGGKKSLVKESQKKQQALSISTQEGAAAKITFGIGNNYITPFALALKANSFHIGLISSLTGILPQLAQIYGTKIMKKYTRKQIMARFIILEGLLWIPLAILGILYWQNIIQNTLAIYALIVVYTLSTIAAGIPYPAWFSWMGDLVEKKHRGAYFSKRNLIIGIVEIAAMLMGVILIRAFEKQGYLILGLSIFFIIAAFFRIISWRLIKKQYEPVSHEKEESSISFSAIKKKYPNFNTFVIYIGVFHFALMIASPFFAVHMSEQLKFSTAMFMTITLSSSLWYLIFLPLIGKSSDKYGNRTLLYLANACFILSPLLWMISPNPIYLILIPQIVVGIGNAALIIALTNFSYDALPQESRGKCVSYLNISAGIGTFFGSLLGGIILKYVIFTQTNIFMIVFGLSALARFLAAALFLPKIKEERKVERLPPLVLHLSHPFKAIHAEIGLINDMKIKYAQGLKVWKSTPSYVFQKEK